MHRCHRTTRRQTAFRAATLVLAVVALAAGTPAAAAAPVPSWRLRLAIQYLPPATNRSQYDVVMTEPGEVWLLGGSDVGGHGHPVAERLVNGIPHAVAFPSGPHSWVTAASAVSPHDIWAVTALGGSVLTWNGSAWTVAVRGAWKAGTRFTGITAISPKNVWVFGTKGSRYPGAGTWHWTGTRWTRVTGVSIYQASKASATDLWAVGEAAGTMSALLHSGGTAWRRVTPAALAGFTYARVLALAPRNVWVTGSLAGGPELGHFDGHGWTAVAMPGQVTATGLCPDGRGGLWVIANTGVAPSRVLHRSVSGIWTTASVSSRAADKVLACGLVPGTTMAWGAGQSKAPQGSAAAAYRHG